MSKTYYFVISYLEEGGTFILLYYKSKSYQTATNFIGHVLDSCFAFKLSTMPKEEESRYTSID